jgi:hypothetical protein
MNVKKMIAVIMVLVGVVMVGGALYIKDQVAKGKLKVASAERKVEQGKGLFSINPVSKEIGDQVTQSADRKISSAKLEISNYEALAQDLQWGGIILIVVGAGFFIFLRRKK